MKEFDWCGPTTKIRKPNRLIIVLNLPQYLYISLKKYGHLENRIMDKHITGPPPLVGVKNLEQLQNSRFCYLDSVRLIVSVNIYIWIKYLNYLIKYIWIKYVTLPQKKTTWIKQIYHNSLIYIYIVYGLTKLSIVRDVLSFGFESSYIWRFRLICTNLLFELFILHDLLYSMVDITSL